MSRKKQVEELKVPCLALNRIIEIKRVNQKQLKKAISDLKRIIKKGLPISDYIETVLKAFLGNDDLVYLYSLMPTPFDPEKELTPEDLQERALQSNALKNAVYAIYHIIVDHYPNLRIELICSELNDYVPLSQADILPLLDPDIIEGNDLEEEQFEKMVKRETKKATQKKPDRSLTTAKSIEELKSFLQANIIGQDQAIETIINALKLKAVGFTDIVTLFFIGPTGVGKSEVSKLLGEKYSGNFYQINCSDFSNGHEVNKLTGSPPGYIGSAEKSVLLEKAQKGNRWVFLFDEIEKAHEKFFNWLLPLIETGKTSDNQGKEMDFTDSIFIFTSNCGVRDIKTKTINFNQVVNHASNEESLMESIRLQFSPEFRNRIDEFVFFNPITKPIAEKISELKLKKFPIKITKDLIDFVCDNGFSSEYGARQLVRFIKKHIALPVADIILKNQLPKDDSYKYDCVVENGSIRVLNTKSILED